MSLKTALVATVLLALVYDVQSFIAGPSFLGRKMLSLRAAKTKTWCSMQSEDASDSAATRREAMAAMVSSALVAAVSLPAPALADRSFTSMTTAIRNYGPRIKAGISFFEVDLKAAIDQQDWGTVSEAVSEKGKAYRLAYVEKYSSGVVKEVIELKGPMKIFASSITASDSEGPQTQKLYLYLTKYAEFCQKLKEAAAAGDKDAATKAWIGGSFALRLFMDSINTAIPRSVGKIDLPPPPADAAAAFPALKQQPAEQS